MGVNQSNIVNFQQGISNNIVTSSQASCNATNDTQISGNSIITVNSEINQNVGIITASSVDASCIIGNTIDSSISNSITAAVQQENSALTGILGGLGSDVNQDNLIDVAQNVSNNVTQILNSVCQSTNTTDITNNLIYVDGSTVGQNVGIINTGNTSYASCSINNLSKLQIYNQMTASAKQGNSDISLLSLIFIIVIIFVVLCVIVVLAKLFLKGGKGKTEVVVNQATPTPVSQTS